jgi:hypothetical protein
MNLNKLSSIKEFFKEHRFFFIKNGIKYLAIGIICGIMTNLAMDVKSEFGFFLYLIGGLFTSASLLIAFVYIVKYIFNIHNKVDFEIDGSTQINKENISAIMNVLLSIMVFKPDLLNLSLNDIKKIEYALFFNHSVLKELDYEGINKELKIKLCKNANLINQTLPTSLHKLKTFLQDPNFLNVLKNMSIEEKLIMLQLREEEKQNLLNSNTTTNYIEKNIKESFHHFNGVAEQLKNNSLTKNKQLMEHKKALSL